MKIEEILLEGRKKKLHKKDKMHKKQPKHVDLDDNDEPVVDADTDTIPHIMMQLRKAVDVDGDYPITFKNGSKVKLSMDHISDFVKKYMNAKPDEKEDLQNLASNSYEDFLKALKKPAKPEFKHKIKGTRYMSSFAGDLDEK